MKKESKTNNYYKIAEEGSSLIMMALTIIVLGLFLVSVIQLLKVYNATKKDQDTTKNTDIIQAAIDNYVNLEGRYPCPMPIDIAITDPNFGKESRGVAAGTCDTTPVGIVTVAGRAPLTVVIGGLPVRTLGLPDKLIVDGYNKRYTYAITQELTDNSIDVKTAAGGITVEDESGQSVSTPTGFVIYALVSPNEDNRGAYNLNGALLEPAPVVGTTAAENFNNDATFVTSQKFTYRGQATDFTAKLAFKVNPPAFKWSVGDWSVCNGVCFTGTETRLAECRDSAGRRVDDASCSHTARPADSRACAISTACRWVESPWGPCNGVCFSGNQARTVECFAGSTLVPDHYCTHAARSTDSQVCGLPACRWNVVWGVCTPPPPPPRVNENPHD